MENKRCDTVTFNGRHYKAMFESKRTLIFRDKRVHEKKKKYRSRFLIGCSVYGLGPIFKMCIKSKEKN